MKYTEFNTVTMRYLLTPKRAINTKFKANAS